MTTRETLMTVKRKPHEVRISTVFLSRLLSSFTLILYLPYLTFITALCDCSSSLRILHFQFIAFSPSCITYIFFFSVNVLHCFCCYVVLSGNDCVHGRFRSFRSTLVYFLVSFFFLFYSFVHPFELIYHIH